MAKNLLLSVTSLVVIWLLLEGLLAVFGFKLPDTSYYARDQRLGFVLKPGRYPSPIPVRINSLGFRGPELRARGPHTIRIITLGDSCTFGVSLLEEDTYPRRVERILRERDVDAQVINAAVPGYTSLQGRLLLPRIAKLDPDAITIYFGWNDHWLGGILDDQTMVDHPALLRLQGIAARSRVYHALKRLLGVPRPQPVRASLLAIPSALGGRIRDLERYRVPIDEYERNLEAIARWGKGRGIPVIFITPPDGFDRGVDWDAVYRGRGLVHEGDSVTRLHAAYIARMLAVADRTGSEVVDACGILRAEGNAFFGNDPVHPHSEGHALIASALAERIERVFPRSGRAAGASVPGAPRAGVIASPKTTPLEVLPRGAGRRSCEVRQMDLSIGRWRGLSLFW